MTTTQLICAICAWRATCQKKFSVSGKDMRCPEFVKDFLIKEEQEEETGETQLLIRTFRFFLVKTR